LTLHARTAKQFYKGEAPTGRTSLALKGCVRHPGDRERRSRRSARTAIAKMRESGVDAMMLGRAVLGNPWLVAASRPARRPRAAADPAAPERLRFAVHHYRTMVDEWGEARAVPQMRKHLGYYLKGFTARANCASA
jgi:tRNA-dihydrouridine synthase B